MVITELPTPTLPELQQRKEKLARYRQGAEQILSQENGNESPIYKSHFLPKYGKANTALIRRKDRFIDWLEDRYIPALTRLELKVDEGIRDIRVNEALTRVEQLVNRRYGQQSPNGDSRAAANRPNEQLEAPVPMQDTSDGLQRLASETGGRTRRTGYKDKRCSFTG